MNQDGEDNAPIQDSAESATYYQSEAGSVVDSPIESTSDGRTPARTTRQGMLGAGGGSVEDLVKKAEAKGTKAQKDKAARQAMPPPNPPLTRAFARYGGPVLGASVSRSEGEGASGGTSEQQYAQEDASVRARSTEEEKEKKKRRMGADKQLVQQGEQEQAVLRAGERWEERDARARQDDDRHRAALEEEAHQNQLRAVHMQREAEGQRDHALASLREAGLRSTSSSDEETDARIVERAAEEGRPLGANPPDVMDVGEVSTQPFDPVATNARIRAQQDRLRAQAQHILRGGSPMAVDDEQLNSTLGRIVATTVAQILPGLMRPLMLEEVTPAMSRVAESLARLEANHASIQAQLGSQQRQLTRLHGPPAASTSAILGGAGSASFDGRMLPLMQSSALDAGFLGTQPQPAPRVMYPPMPTTYRYHEPALKGAQLRIEAFKAEAPAHDAFERHMEVDKWLRQIETLVTPPSDLNRISAARVSCQGAAYAFVNGPLMDDVRSWAEFRTLIMAEFGGRYDPKKGVLHLKQMKMRPGEAPLDLLRRMKVHVNHIKRVAPESIGSITFTLAVSFQEALPYWVKRFIVHAGETDPDALGLMAQRVWDAGEWAQGEAHQLPPTVDWSDLRSYRKPPKAETATITEITGVITASPYSIRPPGTVKWCDAHDTPWHSNEECYNPEVECHICGGKGHVWRICPKFRSGEGGVTPPPSRGGSSAQGQYGSRGGSARGQYGPRGGRGRGGGPYNGLNAAAPQFVAASHTAR